jgi:hypothetical protein
MLDEEKDEHHSHLSLQLDGIVVTRAKNLLNTFGTHGDAGAS